MPRRQGRLRAWFTPQSGFDRVLQLCIRCGGIDADNLVRDHLSQRRQRIWGNLGLQFPEARPDERLPAMEPGVRNGHDEAAFGRFPLYRQWGEQDRVLPPAYADRWAEGISGPTEIVMVPDAGHHCVVDQPAVTAKHVRSFLDV